MSPINNLFKSKLKTKYMKYLAKRNSDYYINVKPGMNLSSGKTTIPNYDDFVNILNQFIE